jgi:NADH-quinone oxidoreductase subunit L
MFLGVGVGAFSAGIFHLMTHAFFKGLLFLGAGAVIHGLHGEQDMRQMGGLFKHMRITAIALFCASLAISGFPFTSGFFSKDAILVAAYERAPWMYWAGVLTAGMTAFYVFRAWLMTFMGDYRGHAHPHESPLVMTGPLMILAVLSIFGGFIDVPQILEPMFAEKAESQGLAWLSAGVGILGILLAILFYVVKRGWADSFTKAIGGLYTLVYNKYFVDEVYAAAVVEPLVEGSRTVLWRGFDAGLIDGTVNGVGRRSRGVGAILRLLQSGNIRSYAGWVVLGSIVLLIAIGFAGGLR